jgi:multidrug resistance protein
MTTMVAAGVIPAFKDFSKQFKVSIQQASYMTSVQILVLGIAPLFWGPISSRFGRRPVWLFSTLASALCNMGSALSHTYGTMMLTRVLAAICIAPAIALGSAVVVETFFARERGQKTGLWMLAVTLGPPGGPFIMGFVAQHIGWRWIYWIFVILNAVQFVAYFFLSPETRYIRNSNVIPIGSKFKREYMNFGRIDPLPLTARDFYHPALLAKYMSVLIPAISYMIVFGFTGVLMTVEIPQLFGEKFHLNAQKTGLQFTGMIIGSVLGEQVGGPFSDYWVNRKARLMGEGRKPQPEYRLWSSYFGFGCVIVGLLVFGIQLQNAKELHWNATPIVGVGIASFGNQIITTVLVTCKLFPFILSSLLSSLFDLR